MELPIDCRTAPPTSSQLPLHGRIRGDAAPTQEGDVDFRSSIASARSYTTSAINELGRYDHSLAPSAPNNRAVIDRVRQWISPGATRAGADALDASRWERWVSVRQIRDTGTALELLDRAWWSLSDRAGQPDIEGARRSLYDAVSYLDRASYGSRWAAPVAA